jgi:hypothetical protein
VLVGIKESGCVNSPLHMQQLKLEHKKSYSAKDNLKLRSVLSVFLTTSDGQKWYTKGGCIN